MFDNARSVPRTRSNDYGRSELDLIDALREPVRLGRLVALL